MSTSQMAIEQVMMMMAAPALKTLLSGQMNAPDVLEGSFPYVPVHRLKSVWSLDLSATQREFDEFAKLIDEWGGLIRDHSDALGSSPNSNCIYVVPMPQVPNFHFDRGRRTIALGLQNAPTLVALGAAVSAHSGKMQAEVPLGNDQTVPASLDHATIEIYEDGVPVILHGLNQIYALPIAHSPPWSSMFKNAGSNPLSVVAIAHWD